MMWVLFAIALIELVVVHLLVALKWPLAGWPLTIASALGALWILVWIGSFRSNPHVLNGDKLILSFGRFKSLEVSLNDIASVSSSWEQGALQKKDAINLAGIAFPNRCLELLKPARKNKSRVFIRLDEPADFDQALNQARQSIA